MPHHRVRIGDKFQVIGVSSVANEMRARVTVQFDNGHLRQFSRTLLTSADRALSVGTFSGAGMEDDGEVVRAVVAGVTQGIKRGQTAVELLTLNNNFETVDNLLQDYLHAGNNPPLDRTRDFGPGGGNGFIQKRAIADNVTPVDIEHTLGISNALRRIDGFIWYYHRDGTVDDVTLRVSARDFGDGLPTGMTSGGNTLMQLWPTAAVTTLSANQEGTIYVSAQDGSRISISLDNGTRIVEDTSVAAPLPFPYWAGEGDVGELFFDVGNAQAADRHSIYIIEEEWINV